MSEFTPGPWHVVTDLDRIGENWMVCSNGDYVIETEGLKGDEIGDSLADATLLAAAPDLLAAAQRILAWYPESVIATCTENSDQGWQDLRALREAVLKAKV